MIRPDILNYPNSKRDDYFDDLEQYATSLEIAIKGAIAALSQNKTFPSDIKAAKTFLENANTQKAGCLISDISYT